MDLKLPDQTKLAILQAGLDHIDQGISVFDKDFRLIFWNRRYFDLLEFPDELAVAGTPFVEFVRCNAERGEYGPGDAETQVTQRVDLARQLVAHYFERTRPNGVVLAIHGVPLPEGGFITVYTDITEQKRYERLIRERNEELEARVLERTEELRSANSKLRDLVDSEKRIAEALKHSEARLQLITDAVPAGIAYVDSQERYQFANERLARAYGLTKTELIGKSVAEVVGADLLKDMEPYLKQGRRGEEVTFEYDTALPTGRTAHVRTTMLPDLDGDGAVQGYYVLSLDVSDQREAEAALARAQKMEAVAALSGGLAHDFNNLLTVVLGNLVPLRERSQETKDHLELLDPAIEATRRGADLIRRLLTFSRRHPLTPVPVDVTALIDSLVGLLKGSLPETIEIAHASEDGGVHAYVDPHQLENALLNLSFNARDAMPNGGTLKISAGVERIDAHSDHAVDLTPGDYVRIGVSDSGCGIDHETLDRVFEPFFTTKAMGNGSGLGLSMVYGFARQSGGAVYLNSRVREGTEVLLFLPRADEVDIPEAPTPDVAAREDAGGRLVLLVDDNTEVRAVVRRQLIDLGYMLIEASDGDQALELLTNVTDVSVLLTDVVMPGRLDGVALAHEARARRPDLPIVLMSAYADTKTPRGAGDDRLPMLRKPFEMDELDQALRRSMKVR